MSPRQADEDLVRRIAAETTHRVLREYFGPAESAAPEPGVGNASHARLSGNAWRDAALHRYHEGSWKHTIVSLVPYRPFHPVEIYKPNRDYIIERHPNQLAPENGAARTIVELVSDGVLAKIDARLYAPAIHGKPVVTSLSGGAPAERFDAFISDVERRVVAASPAKLRYAHQGRYDPASTGMFASNARFVSLARLGHDHVIISGLETGRTMQSGARFTPSQQLFPNFGVAVEIAMNDTGADFVARAIIAWLLNDTDTIREVRAAVGIADTGASDHPSGTR
ncbi:MAG: hypothetical protein QOJ39_4075 [Candidatus Eremiobacteraeota bacterium]|nr:hypothetical protein [Candidatus Eremiobacteraeota bacterium]